MTETYSFPKFEKTMMEVLKKFGGTKMETYNGEDITPLWNLKGGGLVWSFKYLYAAPKLEKIVITEQSFRDKLMSFALNIIPDNDHALPLYICFWAESAKGSYFILDLLPAADCICDLPYMEKYLEPVEEIYSRALQHYHEISSRDPSWFRAITSPYYINADFGPSTRETQERLVDLALGYLKVYHRLWEQDPPREAGYMKRLNERKEAIRTNFREKDPGGYMMEKAVGKELAELSIKALF
jgi:hypothetical protein